MAAYTFIYRGTENISIEEFLNVNNRLFSQFTSTREFLMYSVAPFFLSNNTRIYLNYDSQDQQRYIRERDEFNLPFIVPGTPLVLPQSQIGIENALLYGANQFLTQRSFNSYWSSNYLTLIQDPEYVKADILTRTQLKTDVNVYFENVKVWVWVRAENKIFNLSSFIRNLSTNKNMDVGSFNLEVDPILNFEGLQRFGGDVLNRFPLNANQGINKDFFEKFIQKNDLVFIRYERLLNEGRRLDRDPLTFEISNNELPGNIWDMIGLVDEINVSYNASSVNKTINIVGRDLMKLIIDDASYFIPLIFVENAEERFLWGGDTNDGYFKRNIISGAYDYYFAYLLKSIPDVIGFIINHLSNLSIVNDELLNTYPDISTLYDVTGADQNYIETKEVKGIWKLVKVFIDPDTNDRRIADDSFANPDGTLLEYFRKICQEPFVEFWGDTNGDNFDFIIRQPPWTRNALRDVVDRNLFITIQENDTISYNLSFDNRYYSWYQIQAQNTLFGTDKYISLSFFPIIYFPQYAEIFGNRRLIIPDNYLFLNALKGDGIVKDLNKNAFVEAILNDFRFIIETNVYLPFTREGIIVINGDRRIKVGTFVRLTSTDELFYVKGVSHSISLSKNNIERITTLSVERGMVFPYIKGAQFFTDEGILIERAVMTSREETEMRAEFATQGILLGDVNIANVPQRVSYFDIVNTDLIINTISRNINQRATDGQAMRVNRPKNQPTTNFGVNQNIFNFFINRNQMR